MAATLVVLQLCSGILLTFMYEPSPVTAYASIQSMIEGVPFGRLMRNLHHWCAHLLVAVILLHMLRVFFTGAFHPPRQFNWIVGLGLAGLVLGANFTGYLLPWDQLAFWAVTVSTGMLEYIPLIGGYLRETILDSGEIGPRTLQIFFALHTGVLPVCLVGLMAFHFWRVRKARGLVIPRRPDQPVDESPETAPTVPDLLLREAATALCLIAVVLLLSTLIDAPLAEPANPGLSPNPIRAPWYFAGLQELLLHLHPVFAVFAIPLIVGAGMMAIPYFNYKTDTGGIWFASRIGRRTAGLAAIIGIIATPLLVLAGTWLSTADSPLGGLAPILGNGWIPALVLIIAVGGCYTVTKRCRDAGRNEAVQSVFTLLLTTYAMLTATSLWLRGEGMVLRLPW
jgi:quinol-cytochrome oxidoreductase complex cytochrome b subunit